MTIEEEKYYENYFDLFHTDGWKQLISELTEIYDSYNVENITSLEELYAAKGERNMLSRMMYFQNGIEAAYASLQAGNSDGGEVVGYDT